MRTPSLFILIIGLLWLNEVNGQIIPEFDPIGPLCQNSIAPVLPDTSLNDISGIWVPPVIDTSVPGNFTFTFIPDEGQDAVEVTMDILIMEMITPWFNRGSSLCQYSIPPALNDTSLNGITGTWNPDTIRTDIPGVFTFVFTPDIGQCVTVYTMEIAIVPDPRVSQTIISDDTIGLGKGIINIIATGSTSHLFYSIDNGFSWQTDNGLFHNLFAGTYNCIIKDENDCDTSFNAVIRSFEGILENNASGLLIHPNPGKGLFEVHLPVNTDAKADVKVINAVGTVVYQLDDVVLSIDNRIDINLSDCADGVYSLILTTKKSVFQGKLILRHN